MCKACVCFRIVRNTQSISLRKHFFYHRNERILFKQINANWSDEWVLDAVRVICSMVHRCGLKPNDAPYMCLEENTSMSAIKIEALTLKVCADFGLCVLHVCDIDKHICLMNDVLCQTLRWRLARMNYPFHCFNDWNLIGFNCIAVPRCWQMLVSLKEST